jgi:hypothetical protein
MMIKTESDLRTRIVGIRTCHVATDNEESDGLMTGPWCAECEGRTSYPCDAWIMSDIAEKLLDVASGAITALGKHFIIETKG